MSEATVALRIAVLINGFESTNTLLVHDSFESAITAASSSRVSPIITFYDPVIAQTYPDPSKYDLIVLSGGSADPMGNDAWILKMQNFLRTTVTGYPNKKMVGICWGHQTMCVAFGGNVGNMDKAEIGVAQIKLTSEGKELFPFSANGTIQIHEFHRRDIKATAKGFVPLAEGNQVFLNEANTILTFQGHPEMNGALARKMLESSPGYMGVDGEQKHELAETLDNAHDGVEIWRRILACVGE